MQSSLPRPKPRGMTTPKNGRRSSTPWTPPPASPGVRYLDIRVAIPADCPPDQVADYLSNNAGTSFASPLTVASSPYHGSPSPDSRSDSPFGFIPIDSSLQTPKRSQTRSPFSPSSFSLKSTGTAETAESSLVTTESSLSAALRKASPATIDSLAPPIYSPDNHSSPRPKKPTITSRHTTFTRPGTPSSLRAALSPRSKSHSSLKDSSSSVSSPRPGTPHSSGHKSPFVESDETVKKTRMKTELCMHYSKGRECPFGDSCTYAHGDDELQLTSLLDMHKAGLVDKETYRTRPCFTWVATGSCPFGKRCCSLHDPRCAGEFPSWLTHTETQGNNIATDINVEAFYNKTEHEIHRGTPFGEQFLLSTDSFNDLYKRVGNIVRSKKDATSWVVGNRRRPPSLSVMIKLQAATIMRGDSDFSFKYRPQHIIHGEQCMVLQKRAFQVPGEANASLAEISHREYSQSNKSHLMIWELAFGPDSDSAARPVALWFNIDQSQVVECSITQAKRFRWKRGLKNSKETRRSVFDHLDHFQMIRPHDKDAFDLTTDMLHNRLRMLQAEQTADLKDRQVELASAKEEKDKLRERFDALLKHWVTWGWPVNKGRANVDKHTPVPAVDCQYELPIDSLARADVDAELKTRELSDDEETVMGQQTLRLWQSFVRSKEGCSELDPSPEAKPTNRRLPIFGQLALGKGVADDRTLPHIRSDSLSSQHVEDGKKPCRHSERCWKALLLPRNATGFVNDWDLVREHFEKSRTQKVLSIIQQK